MVCVSLNIINEGLALGRERSMTRLSERALCMKVSARCSEGELPERRSLDGGEVKHVAEAGRNM